MTVSYDKLIEKWSPVLDEESAGTITDHHKKAVTAAVLENQEIALREEGLITEAAPANATSSVSNWNPVLIALVRRAMPNLMAYDVCGVQPMSGPSGLIFAMRSRYENQGGEEALFNEPDAGFTAGLDANAGDYVPRTGAGVGGDAEGNNPALLNDASPGTYEVPRGFSREDLEQAGDASKLFREMSFSIEKTSVTAKSRALKAEYTLELAQDLKAIHGLDAEQELANILSSEVLAEINREVVRRVYSVAKPGAQNNVANAGSFDLDVDSNGRWSVEKFKGLLFQIERDANAIAQRTRRGKGNIIMCSADVASALTMAGVLDYTPALNANLNVDDTGNTFAGTLMGKFRVYIDPYAANLSAANAATNGGNQYYVVGYKGTSPYDAGLFYCPYVPLQMVRAVGENSFQPKIGFKTRYGLVSNPFAEGTTQGLGRLRVNSNRYYQRVTVKNLM